MKGRQILDLVLIANESVEEYKAKKKKGLSLKLILRRLMIMSNGISSTMF